MSEPVAPSSARRIVEIDLDSPLVRSLLEVAAMAGAVSQGRTGISARRAREVVDAQLDSLGRISAWRRP